MSRIEIYKNSLHIKWQYNIFSTRSYPYLGITSPINIDYLVNFSKETHISFYALMSYIVMKTIQEIDEFKYVLDKDKIYKYDKINMSFTVLNEDLELRFSPMVTYDNDMLIFLKRFLNAKSIAEKNRNENTNSENNIVYITCTPWMRVTSLIQPMDEQKKDSIPRIGENIFLPLKGTKLIYPFK